MRRLIALQVTPAMILLFASTAFAAGWQAEQVITPNAADQRDTPEGHCSSFPDQKSQIICVYSFAPVSPGQSELYQVTSWDGGVTWSSPVRLTDTNNDFEFDPYTFSDPLRNRVYLLYSRMIPDYNAGADLMITWRTKNGSWSSPVTTIRGVGGDGHHHWDSSGLALANGELLVLETLGGDDYGRGAQIRRVKSADGGLTWGAPAIIYDGPYGESMPFAMQNPDGAIGLWFLEHTSEDRVPGFGPEYRISYVASFDNGGSFCCFGVFWDTAYPDRLGGVYKQSPGNVTVMMVLWTGVEYAVHHMQSWDGGVTWFGPYRTSDVGWMQWVNVDPGMTVGCRGNLFFYNDGYPGKRLLGKRYDWYNSCDNAGDDQNLALNKPATQSSDPGWGGPASKAVDGNTDGNWAAGSVTHTNFDVQGWWQVDLIVPQAVHSVEIWNRTDCCSERLSNFNVLLLDSNHAAVASTYVAGQAGSPTTVALSGMARYVRVQLVGTNWLSLAEVKVWGTPAALTNLALNKPATQSSDVSWGGPAGKALDGNADGNWAAGSVTHTNFDAQAWWQVDLGSPQVVQGVEVWNRTDCCSERLTNFNILLLDSNQAVVGSAYVAGQAGSPTTVALSGTARYVRVQLAGTNYLSLAEVKVWGTP